MARTSKTIYAILGILSIQPMSGYEIRRRLTQHIGPFWSESDGQLYPALEKLEKEKLIVRKKETDNTASKRQRQIYALTPDGTNKLKTWLREPAAEVVGRNELMLKLFFGCQMSKQEYLEHIERQTRKLQDKLKYEQAIETHLCEEHLHKINPTTKKTNEMYIPEAFYWLLTLKCGIEHTKAELEWCKYAANAIKNKSDG